MPTWGMVLLIVLAVWLVLSVLLAFAIGRAIRIADRRSPRKPHKGARRAPRARRGAGHHLTHARRE
ncbi:MAG: hypothetical protein ACTHJL_10685 [Amnibacterium sp.]